MEHAAPEAPAWLLWLQDGALGGAMRRSILLYPAVEILHILGFALLVGAIVALDLRLLGLRRPLPADALGALLLPVAVGGFALAAPTGALLFLTEAASIAGNPAFLLKMALVVAALGNAALLHLGAWRRIAAWRLDRPPGAVRAAAVLSLLLWIAVLGCGRMIAYL